MPTGCRGPARVSGRARERPGLIYGTRPSPRNTAAGLSNRSLSREKSVTQSSVTDSDLRKRVTGSRAWRRLSSAAYPPGAPGSGARPSSGSPDKARMVARSAERSVAAGTRGGRGWRGDPHCVPWRPAHLRHVPGAAGHRAGPGWTQAVSREIAGFLRSSVTAAWRHGWQPASWPGTSAGS